MNRRHAPLFLPGRIALTVASLSLLAAAVLLVLYPTLLLRAWLFAWLVCLNVSLGALAILLIHSLTGGAWGNHLALPLRAAVGTLPAIALWMLPLWFVLPWIFPWANPAQRIELTPNQALWLQPWLLMLRSTVYFAVWTGIAATLATWSARRPLRQSAGLAAPGAILFVLATTLFAVDWLMSLLPENRTSMIGFLFMSEQLVAGFALAALWISLCGLSAQFNYADPQTLNDCGNLLLAALMMHGYCLYMDYLIVWQTNLPGEIDWYLRRLQNSGSLLVWLFVCLCILLPIFLLLFRRVKRSAMGLGAVAAIVLLGHLCVVYWYLAPIAPLAGSFTVLRDWLPGLAFIGCWITLFLFAAQRLAVQQR